MSLSNIERLPFKAEQCIFMPIVSKSEDLNGLYISLNQQEIVITFKDEYEVQILINHLSNVKELLEKGELK